MIDVKSILSNFSKKKTIGCDLGASCLKIVQLARVENGLSLVNKGICKIPDTLEPPERWKKIQEFAKQNNFILDGLVSVNIEDASLLIRRMDLPKMPDRDTKTAISWNFREFVSGAIEDCIVNYLPIEGAFEGDKVPVTAFCVAREAVWERQNFMKSAGIKASAIESNAVALLSAFNHCYGGERDKYYVVLDLGDSISNFVVIGNGSLMFSRPLTRLHGRKLVQQVSKTLVIEESDAAEGLKNYLTSLTAEKTDAAVPEVDKVADTVSDFISKLIVEVQRSIDAFCIMYKKDHVDKLYLCGGGICLPGLAGRFSSGLGVEVELLNPFKNILHAETAAALNTAPMYAVAVGLAIPGE